MNQRTFDTFVRRTANLFDRRSLLGGAGAALLAAGVVPRAAEAKKPGKNKKNKRKHCQKSAKDCRRDLPDFCDGDQECIDALGPCCAHEARCNNGKARECCRQKGFCE
jgi:hypothetical protein